MKTRQCPSQQELVEFDSGLATSQRGEEILNHLEHCDDCSELVDSLSGDADNLIPILRQQLPEEIIGEDSELRRLVDVAGTLQDTSVADCTQTMASGVGRHKPTADDVARQLLTPTKTEGELGSLGGYRVLSVIGMGGMGVVFKAEDVRLKRKIALKAVLPHVAASSASAGERFLREAQAMAAIHHDNIVTIYQVGYDGDVPFMAMQLLAGESVAGRLVREGRLSVGESCRITREVATGLATAHEKELTHRDIKPDNIWLEAGTGRVKILDFGLARLADNQQDVTPLGTVVGTPSYLAPEQARGQKVDDRADLFSLGVVAYQMLTGRSPFRRESTLATLRAIDSETPPAPVTLRVDMPSELSDLVMRLLKKNPETRIQSAQEVIQSLDRIENTETESASDPVADEDSSRTTDRRGALLIATTALLLLFGIIITIKDKHGRILATILGPNEAIIEVQHAEQDGNSEAPRRRDGVRGSKPEQESIGAVSNADDNPNYAISFAPENAQPISVPELEFSEDEPVTFECTVLPGRHQGGQLMQFQGAAGQLQVFFPARLPGIKKKKRIFAGVADETGYSGIHSFIYPDEDTTCHIAVVYHPGQLSLFVNGTLEGRLPRGKLRPSEFPGFTTCENLPELGRFTGLIDELRVSSIARYTENYVPRARFEPDEHTLLLYHFDEGRGDVFRDSSGNANHERRREQEWILIDR